MKYECANLHSETERENIKNKRANGFGYGCEEDQDLIQMNNLRQGAGTCKNGFGHAMSSVRSKFTDSNGIVEAQNVSIIAGGSGQG